MPFAVEERHGLRVKQFLMNLAVPFSRVKLAGSMKKVNAFGPEKNTIVLPSNRVLQTLPYLRVPPTENPNGSLPNSFIFPRKNAPMSPGGSFNGCFMPLVDGTADAVVVTPPLKGQLPAAELFVLVSMVIPVL